MQGNNDDYQFLALPNSVAQGPNNILRSPSNAHNQNSSPQIVYSIPPGLDNSPVYLPFSPQINNANQNPMNYYLQPSYSPQSSSDCSNYSVSSSPLSGKGNPYQVYFNQYASSTPPQPDCLLDGYYPPLSNVTNQIQYFPIEPMSEAEQLHKLEQEKKALLRREKNKQAAKQCRIKKKEYTKELEKSKSDLEEKLKVYIEKFGDI